MNSLLKLVVFSAVFLLLSAGGVVKGDEGDSPPPNVGDTEREEPDIKRPDDTPDHTTPPDEENELKPSPYAETSVVFVKPAGATAGALPGGKEVRSIIGLYNKGETPFLVDRIEAAFHYPLDYSYHIQNFTTIRYAQLIDAGKVASFDYIFVPSDMLASRTFGLVISVYYSDLEGKSYRSAAHNSTINIYEPDEGFDGETMFMYLTLIALTGLALVGGHHFIVTAGLRKIKAVKAKVQAVVETGTQSNKTDVDYDWLPEGTVESFKKSKESPKTRTSPRLRASTVKRRTGGAEN